MAQRRMFSPDIVASDAFVDMPLSSQALYFHLGMYADDDGFVNPRKIMRMVNASDDDLKILISKRFVMPFENGVVVIKHWRINNLLRKDWYRPTQYIEQKDQLFIKENGAYTLDEKQGLLLGNGSVTSRQRSIGKDSVVKDSVDTEAPSKKFKEPTLDEVTAYCKERENAVRPQQFIDFYTSKGWKVGNQKMKDWKACVRTWEQRDKGTQKVAPGNFENVKVKKV